MSRRDLCASARSEIRLAVVDDRIFTGTPRCDGFEIKTGKGEILGVLEKGSSGPAFTSIIQTAALVVASGDEERARRWLATAEKHGIIANSLRVAVSLISQVHADNAVRSSS